MNARLIPPGLWAWVFIVLATPASAEPGDCIVPPMSFSSEIADLSGEMTVKAGKGCGFGISGIEGVIDTVSITSTPKVGMAGVRGSTVYYIAKPGYRGPDEFAYAFVGKDQYGGPMRVTVKRRITVVP